MFRVWRQGVTVHGPYFDSGAGFLGCDGELQNLAVKFILM